MQLIDIIERLVDRVLALESSLFWGGILVWLAFALAVAGVASGRGQSPVGFFVLALVLSPVIAMLVLLAMPDLRQRRLDAYEARVRALEAHLAIAAPTDPATPMMSPSASVPVKGPSPVLAWALIIALILLAVIGGVSRLGSSANTTFTTISGSM